jgi:hypothetical protein
MNYFLEDIMAHYRLAVENLNWDHWFDQVRDQRISREVVLETGFMLEYLKWESDEQADDITELLGNKVGVVRSMYSHACGKIKNALQFALEFTDSVQAPLRTMTMLCELARHTMCASYQRCLRCDNAIVSLPDAVDDMRMTVALREWVNALEAAVMSVSKVPLHDDDGGFTGRYMFSGAVLDSFEVLSSETYSAGSMEEERVELICDTFRTIEYNVMNGIRNVIERWLRDVARRYVAKGEVFDRMVHLIRLL